MTSTLKRSSLSSAVAHLGLVRSMNAPRTFSFVILSLTAVALIHGQSVTTGAPRGATVYATYAAKPDYPYVARVHHIEGSGVFTVHIGPDGKVQNVDTTQSTGNKDLDLACWTALRKWRFRAPGHATKVEIPFTFAMAPGVERSHPLHPTRSE
jgi:TonB family protein